MGLGEQLEVLEHQTLVAAVEAFKYTEEGELAAALLPGQPRNNDGGDGFSYDIMGASRGLAQPGQAGAASKPVSLAPIGSRGGKCISTDEHVFLDGAKLAALRLPGSIERDNAARKIAEELRRLDLRRIRLRDWAIAQMLTGTLTIAKADVKAVVDYGVRETHKPTATVSWKTTTTDIAADLATWRALVAADCGLDLRHSFINSTVMAYLLANTKIGEKLSDVQKGAISENNVIVKYAGLTWHVFDGGYVPDGGSFTKLIADDKVILTPEPSPEWFNLIVGSKYIKQSPGDTQLTEVFGPRPCVDLPSDPPGIKLMHGDTFMPCLFIPDAIVYADVTP